MIPRTFIFHLSPYIGKLKIPALLAAVYLIQLELVEQLVFFDIAPNILLSFTIAASLLDKRNLGIYTGLGLGLAYDLYLPTVFGLSAFVYVLVAYLLGTFAAGSIKDAKVLTALIGWAATVFGILTYVVVGEIFGQNFLWEPGLWKIILVQSLFNAPFTILSLKLMRLLSKNKYELSVTL